MVVGGLGLVVSLFAIGRSHSTPVDRSRDERRF